MKLEGGLCDAHIATAELLIWVLVRLPKPIDKDK